MKRLSPSIAALILACASLGACSPKPSAEQAQSSPPPAATPAPPPAKPMKMVCKNSQNGSKVACGTPNAVMVGMEPV